MRRTFRLLFSALALALVPVALLPDTASANGQVVVGMPSATANNRFGLSNTCSGSGFATWAAAGAGFIIEFGGSTTCTMPWTMSGRAELIPSGGSMPVNTVSFPAQQSASASTPTGSFVVPASSTFFIRYVTTVFARQGFTWTTVPPQCSVNGQLLTCTLITSFLPT